ncbi:MAG: ketol-acid reductoisomerase [Thermoplasmatales archaeon]|nr:ketol-acid reductoisomerase [Thermoplasmatales archaeon]
MKAYYEKDADLKALKGKKITVVGYGSQGRAQSMNLRDSGMDVTIGLREKGKSWTKAQSDGFKPMGVREACEKADVIMVLIPDEVQSEVYKSEIAPALKPGKTLDFGHGFNIHFKRITPPDGVDVVMVAPKSPGPKVRSTYEEGFGTPSLVAVEKDYSGKAWDVVMALAKGIGATRAGVIKTTFKEETETDNFGEQAVLCGGITGLIGEAFKILISEGYQPEIAYFEVLHEMKLIVDLIQNGGFENMWNAVSNTAEYGGRTRGSRIIDQHVVNNMREVLKEVQNGNFADEWMNEYHKGIPNLSKMRSDSQKETLEQVGKELRSMFVKK